MNLCICGCGQEIPWRKYHKFILPQYLPGHYSKTQENRHRRDNLRIKPPPDFDPTGFCECGCGQKTPIASRTRINCGQYKDFPIRYILGHHPRGKRSHNWKGRIRKSDGYWLIFMPGHHLANKGGYILEHRLVWEQHNNRRLLPGEHVHHIDGNPSNNTPENLVAMKNRDHLKNHFSTPEARLKKSVNGKNRFKKPEERFKMSIAAKKGWKTRKSNLQNPH